MTEVFRPPDAGRLRRLLSMASSDNDAEALIALRHAKAALAAGGHSLSDLANDSAVRALSQNSPSADCIEGLNQGTLLLRPAPMAVTVPPDARAWTSRIAAALSHALNAAAGQELRIRTCPVGDETRVYAQVGSLPAIEIWRGSRAEATSLAAAIRPAVEHASRKGST